MIDYKDVSVVIPCFNEAGTIVEVIKRIRAVSDDFEIIVSSDGSTDETEKLARDAGALVVSHTYNLGNGAAVKTGAQRATRPYLLFMDGDLQHQPEDIPKLMAPLPEYDMVVGARSDASKTSTVRNVGNFLLSHIAQIICGKRIADLTSGFRVVKREAFMRFFHLYPQKYSYPTTITLSLLSTEYFVKYVPLDTIVRRTTGTSNISPLKDGLRFIQIILRVIMLFSPQKIFIPIAATAFVVGLAISIMQLIYTSGIHSSGVIVILSSVLFFINGLLAEQLSQIRLGGGRRREPSDSEHAEHDELK